MAETIDGEWSSWRLRGSERLTVTLLVEPAELDGSELVVEGDAYQHLFRAARAATGDALRVVDGRGRAREGKVAGVERRRATVTLGAEAPPCEPRLELELLVAAPRPSRASWLVEKGTELGVRAFRFLDCERSARSLDERRPRAPAPRRARARSSSAGARGCPR